MKPTLLDVVLMTVGETENGSVLRVERTGAEVSLQHAKDGEFMYWERRHGGCFRRYPKRIDAWGHNDKRKFEFIERERHCVFFLVVEEEDMKIFPPRHLSL